MENNKKKDSITAFIIEMLCATLITAIFCVSAYALEDKFPIFNIF